MAIRRDNFRADQGVLQPRRSLQQSPPGTSRTLTRREELEAEGFEEVDPITFKPLQTVEQPIPQPSMARDELEAEGFTEQTPYEPGFYGEWLDYLNRGFNRGASFDFLTGAGEVVDAGARALGISIPYEEPTTVSNKAWQTAGTTVGMIPGIATGTNRLLAQGMWSGGKYLAPYARQAAQTLTRPFLGGTRHSLPVAGGATVTEGVASGAHTVGQEEGALGLPPGEAAGILGGLVSATALGLAPALAPARLAGVVGRAVRGPTERAFKSVAGMAKDAWQNPRGTVTAATDTALDKVGLGEQTGQYRAGYRLAAGADDPAAAIAATRLRALEGIDPFTQTGQSGILAVHQARVLGGDAAKTRIHRDVLRRQQQEAVGELDVLARRADAPGQMEQARVDLDTVVTKLGTARSREEASEIVSENLGRAYDRARRQEGNLWENLPDDPTTGKPYRINTAKLFERYQRLEKDLSVPEKDDMPAGVRKMLGDPPPTTDKTPTGQPAWSSGSPFIRESLPPERLFSGLDRAGARTPDTQTIRRLKPEESFNNIHGFYSKMRETARIARANGKRNEARLATELADEAWDVLVKEAPGGPRSAFTRALTDVRTYSREFNQAFRQGRVGELLGFQRAGDPKVDAIALLQTALKGTGPKRAAALDDLNKALAFGQRGGSPLGSRMASVGGQAHAMSATDDSLKREFLTATSLDNLQAGQLPGKNAGRTWIGKNKELLDRRPGLQAELEQAAEAMEVARRLTLIGQTVKTAFNDPSPSDALARLIKGAKKRELPTIQAAVMERMMFPGERGRFAALLPEGQGFEPNMAHMEQMVSSPAMRPALEKIWGKEGLQRIDELTLRLGRLGKGLDPESWKPVVPGEEIVEPPEFALVSKGIVLASRLVGARRAAKLGGGTAGGGLQAASMGATGLKGITEASLRHYPDQWFARAARDPVVFRALMEPIKVTPDGMIDGTGRVKQAVRVLNRVATEMRKYVGTQAQQAAMPSFVGTVLADVPTVTSHEYRQGMPVPRIGNVVGRAGEKIDQLISPDRQENRR